MAEPRAGKDFWDKFSSISVFLSSVIVAGVGLVVAWMFDQRQAQANELEVLEKFIPHLVSTNPIEQKLAIIDINTLATTKVAAQIVQLYPTTGTVAGLRAIATNGSAADRAVAENTLNTLKRSAAPQSVSQGASTGANIDCPEQQHIKDFILNHPPVPPPPSDTGLGYFAQRVSQLSVAQQQIVYQRSVAYNPLSATADDIVNVLASHCRLADLESLAGRTKNPTAAWKTADYAPNAQTENDLTKASADLVAGEMAAELAVEARGLVSEATLERLYIAFEPVIPLSTIPMKFREGSVTALTR